MSSKIIKINVDLPKIRKKAKSSEKLAGTADSLDENGKPKRKCCKKK